MAGSLKKFAEALALGMSPTDSAEAAGYPCGKSEKTFAANARRRAGSKRVREIVDELQKPAKEKIQQQIAANMEWATRQLFEVGNRRSAFAIGATRFAPSRYWPRCTVGMLQRKPISAAR